ncbi:MAG: tetratricopeptide repeat protein [Gammaproteobacteria bacterium]
MWILGLSILVQVLLIVHASRPGRNTIWIWVLALLSYAGIIAYVAAELLPDLFRSRTAQRASRNMKKALDPGAELRRYENEARVGGGNVASVQRYAEELTRQGRYDEAITQYRKALTGLYEHDPNLMLGVAQAQFGKGDAAGARQTLDELIRLNPRLQVTARPSALRARSRDRGRCGQGARGIQSAGALLSRRGSRGSLCRSC